MFWSALDRFGTYVGQFFVGIVLARLLLPKDFGLIGMLAIFLAISQTFVDSGMASGLIQKTDRSDQDFSTVFVFNFFVSLAVYSVLFFSAPYIADFYNEPQLVNLSRVLLISLIVDSLSVVQRTKLTIGLDFKTIAKINIIRVVVSGIIGVLFALKGYGVWALVAKTLSGSISTSLMFWLLGNWRFSIRFSRHSFFSLFGFGSKLLSARLYAQTLNNIYNIVIGKAYSATDLGYYANAERFTNIASNTVTGVVRQVTYPILSSLKNNPKRMLSAYTRLIRLTTFIVFPLMTIMLVLTDPFIKLVLSEKWIAIIPYIQWLCLARVVTPISALNMNILNAIGRSDLYLKLELSKAPLIIITLLITLPLGVEAVVIGNAIRSLIAFFINAYLPGRLFGYGAVKQIKDIFPVVFSSVVMGGIVFLVIANFNIAAQIVIGPVLGVFIFFSLCFFLGVKEFNDFILLIKEIRNK
jgi:O-antigen/teichoic acid export membrane protein